MERISIEDQSSEGSFDIFCMFSIVRQVINSRQMVGQSALSQLPGMSKSILQKLKSQGCYNLRQVVMNVKNGTTKGLPARLLNSIKRMPLFSAENMSLSFENKVATPHGTLKFDLVLEAGGGETSEGKKRREGMDDGSFGLTVAIGTQEKNILLDQKNIMMFTNRKKSTSRRAITLKFDWNVANAHGGSDSGNIVLRILSTDRRGMDVKYQIKLK